VAEVSKDAMWLITVSWQALKRAEREEVEKDEVGRICDCTVVLAFAGFFVEATLAHIIEALGEWEKMLEFLDMHKTPFPTPTLFNRFQWFYNKRLSNTPVAKKSQLPARDEMMTLLEAEFPGIRTLFEFRNSVAHGTMHKVVLDLGQTVELRKKAKAIASKLRETASAGSKTLVSADVGFKEAFTGFTGNSEDAWAAMMSEAAPGSSDSTERPSASGLG
jgi:hypothetical protein